MIPSRDVGAEEREATRVASALKYAEDIVQTLREGLVVLEHGRQVRTTNRAFRTMFGLADAGLDGRLLEDLGRKVLADPRLAGLLAQVLAGGSPPGLTLEHADDPANVRSLTFRARRTSDGGLVLLTVDDVSEVERLRRTSGYSDLGRVLVEAREGVLLLGPGGRIDFANRAVATLFGYRADELVGQPIDFVVVDAGATTCAAATTPFPKERVGRRRDGSMFPIELALSTVTRDNALVTVAFVDDITERRASEKKIHAYQARLQRMAFEAALLQDRERRRIAVELHDRLGQSLALAQITLSGVGAEATGRVHEAIEKAVSLLSQAIVDTRTLAFDLSPPVLYDLGLKEALEWLGEDVEKRHGLAVRVDGDAASMLDESSRTVVFRAVRELLMNVVKHARASGVSVALHEEVERLRIDVVDDGVGFHPDVPTLTAGREGFGLLSVREQLHGLGGAIDICAAPGEGTRVSLDIPLRRGAPASTDRGRVREGRS